MKRTQNREETLDVIIGKHYIYTYENGWQYEFYVKNVDTADFRIHSGMVGGRWVKDQKVFIVALSDSIFKISWDEPTGAAVSLAVNLARRQVHATIFFPRWMADAPEKTVCYQNEHLGLMYQYRDAGPTYPRLVINEFATITFLEDCGADRDDVINCAPSELPTGYTSRKN